VAEGGGVRPMVQLDTTHGDSQADLEGEASSKGRR
jgi:hypothetical protein